MTRAGVVAAAILALTPATVPQDKPPPVREILRVAEYGESWGVPADWE